MVGVWEFAPKDAAQLDAHRFESVLRATKPQRGRKRTAETIEKRLASIEEQLASADGLTDLRLVQE